MLTFLWCLEYGLKHVELALRNGALGHGESDAELGGRDVARSQTVEIAEELRDADALLLALLAHAGDDVFHVFRAVAYDLGLAHAGLGLREVVGAVVVALPDSEKLLGAVDVLAEVHVVDLVDVALVHVATQQGLQDVLGGLDAQQVKQLLVDH